MSVGVLTVIARVLQRLAGLGCALPPGSPPSHARIHVARTPAEVSHPTDVLDLVIASLPGRDAMAPDVRLRRMERPGMDQAEAMAPPAARSCRSEAVTRPAGSAAWTGWHRERCSPSWTPRMEWRPCACRGARCGACERRGSAGTRHGRWGCSWRRLATQRVAAWRSPSCLSGPSPCVIGSGRSGRTARWAGGMSAAPNL